MILGGRSCSTSSFRRLNRNGKTWRWRASIAEAPMKETCVNTDHGITSFMIHNAMESYWQTKSLRLEDLHFLLFQKKSSSRRDNSLSVGRGLWNEKGETDGKSRVKPSNISVKYTKYWPYDSWKAGASCRGRFLFSFTGEARHLLSFLFNKR